MGNSGQHNRHFDIKQYPDRHAAIYDCTQPAPRIQMYKFSNSPIGQGKGPNTVNRKQPGKARLLRVYTKICNFFYKMVIQETKDLYSNEFKHWRREGIRIHKTIPKVQHILENDFICIQDSDLQNLKFFNKFFFLRILSSMSFSM